jgi:hypothetical protein
MTRYDLGWLLAASLLPAALVAQKPELPLKHAPEPTSAAISAADLMTRLYIFADDSMMGREVGTMYHLKATDYIEREVRRLGLVPAGDSGSYFQDLHIFVKSVATAGGYDSVHVPARNVVAILPGSDPVLRNEYVAIGAHNDHIGFKHVPVDHDSIRAFNAVVRPRGADDPNRPARPEEVAAIRQILDSLRRIHTPRLDSIYNGADDDGSGSVAVLEIAEAFAKSETKPKRSILFVWHAGEEKGLWGSEYFTDHPTVPRDSIVAQLNMDMVGRGGPQDEKGGGPGYLQLIGSRRLSTELGDLVEAVAKPEPTPFHFDYSYDANGHPEQYYCRSDHYEYARYGIPITFFSTGGHRDYHQVTDEPQYIDYDQLARVTDLVHDVALRVANLDHRVVVDKPRPNPKGRCVQ